MPVSMRQWRSAALPQCSVSMRRHVFGYVYGPPNRPYALKLQLERAKAAFNFSAILVGTRRLLRHHHRADVTRITYAISAHASCTRR